MLSDVARAKPPRSSFDAIGFEIVGKQPAREPQSASPRFAGHNHARDGFSGLCGLAAPKIQQWEKRHCVGGDFFERLAGDAVNHRGDQPLRQVHLDHRDKRAVGLEGGDGIARFERL
jgi:hypothetical protein